MTVSRRNALRFGLSALATAMFAPSAIAGRSGVPAKSCIVLFAHGGPSQFETFDPKPGRRTGGEFGSIRTKIAGVHFSELLPQLARRADRLAVLRSLSYREGSHHRARYLVQTGYVPAGAVQHPGVGALIAEAKAGGGALPGYVAIGGPGKDPGFLGAQWTPFVVGDPLKKVQNIQSVVSKKRMDRRLTMFEQLQDDFRHERSAAAIEGHDDIVEQAVRMMRAPDVEAFDLEREPEAVRERYGMTKFGQGCLMARRLVERGVPFVQVTQQGWDTHQDNFGRTKALCGDLDPAFAALLDDLAASGKLDETVILWIGDFGRSPQINNRGGRDHYPAVANAVLAGGGLPVGQVIGETDDDGVEVRDNPIDIPDLLRTLTTRLGMDPDKTRMSPEGRPMSAVDGGKLIRALT